jgi:hypothetical protein
MGTAIPVKRRLGAADLRKRACASQDSDQARRLLALAAVLDGQSRGAAARIGGNGSSDPARPGACLQRERVQTAAKASSRRA